MKISNYISKTIGQILFVIIFLSTSPAKSLDKFNKADRISNYLSGVLSFNDNQYEESFSFLKKLNGLETSHINYSTKYLYSLINSGNINEAFNYSKKLEKKKLGSFESYLITGLFYLKNSKIELAQKYFLKAKTVNSNFILNNYVSGSLYNWSKLNDNSLNYASSELGKLNKRFNNLNRIQEVFLNCFFDNPNTNNLFQKLISDEKTDFSRYNYFYASFHANSGKLDEANEIVKNALKLYPRNLLLNQYKIDLNQNNKVSNFNCKNLGHVIAEVLYITANALSSQSIYPLSNFYLNLSKYLNKDFHFYNALLAENFYEIESFKEARRVYNNLSKKGKAFNWYSSKQIARIYVKENNIEKAIDIVSSAYENLSKKDLYETFDYAEFLKNNEKFKEAIPYYSKIINEIDDSHILYSESRDGRGVAYERIGKWDKAEKDFIASLKSNPDQAYVINYLAYSWIEKGINIKKSLNMLEKANKLRMNDPYITDSLGWALFKLKRYEESKNYLQLAVKLLPGDPIVNDHYGDVLWKNGNEIQARYYWNFVLNLEKTEDELKRSIEKKLIKGL